MRNRAKIMSINQTKKVKKQFKAISPFNKFTKRIVLKRVAKNIIKESEIEKYAMKERYKQEQKKLQNDRTQEK